MRTDRGYALVAALAAVAAFSYLAFQVLASGAGARATVAARDERARLDAAAEAGVMIALHGLGVADPDRRWSVDGTPHHADFAGAALTITIEDERAKAPLSGLNDAQARTLFDGAGATGGRLDALVAEFHDWRYAGVAPDAPRRQVEAVGELMTLRDMDAGLYARVAPAVSVHLGPGETFEPRYATPLALATMQALGHGVGIAAAPNLSDAAATPDDRLVGHTLSLHVLARAPDGGEARRIFLVEMTGNVADPYWLRGEE